MYKHIILEIGTFSILILLLLVTSVILYIRYRDRKRQVDFTLPPLEEKSQKIKRSKKKSNKKVPKINNKKLEEMLSQSKDVEKEIKSADLLKQYSEVLDRKPKIKKVVLPDVDPDKKVETTNKTTVKSSKEFRNLMSDLEDVYE